MTTQDEINRLDLAYQKLSGHHFKASGVITGREYTWSQFIKAGYGLSDLEATILWIKHRILEGKRFEGSLRFRTLIGNLDNWEDECAIAKAERRNAKPQPTPRERVLSQARPTAQERVSADVTAKPIGEYIAKLRASVEQL